ncbi:transposase [Aliikangiella marina]|uniref:Transposase n=1 Tax=Aliikangiella marina TaxID=1712262 RepID=A0A545TJ52_9GAMM|nr:transposase [Aliikangiella marina]TQV77245.1 transposase [Aliikangiella marina]
MAIPRKNLIDPESPGFYHCMNRCVRRAFLCGFDPINQQSYEHRKTYIEQRIKTLSSIFAVDIYAYAVMSNHYHIVMYVDPKAPYSWSDEEVVERWLKVFPSRLDSPQCKEQRAFKIQAILNSAELLDKYRERLGSVSWFMRRLNEPLAKASNQEDNCTGKFWEGRFSSQALLDEAAVLSCMAYVDLNPIRAKISDKLEQSNHTSIKTRLNELQETSDNSHLDTQINPTSGQIKRRPLATSLKSYIELVDWAGKSIIYPNKSRIPLHVASTLERLNLQSYHWLKQVEVLESKFTYYIGPVELIRRKAQQLSKKYLHGISSAFNLYSAVD